jgi:quercetin dioxygenase-like cupin family protein
MKRPHVLLALICWVTLAQGQGAVDAPAPIQPGQLHWMSPPGLPALQGAWVAGHETSPGLYVLRVRLAEGGRIPPHTHPDTRVTTVLSGTLYAGFGAAFDERSVIAIPAGVHYTAPAGVPHFLWAKDGGVEYVESGAGPSATTFRLH